MNDSSMERSMLIVVCELKNDLHSKNEVHNELENKTHVLNVISVVWVEWMNAGFLNHFKATCNAL